jgi:biotin carboxylase
MLLHMLGAGNGQIKTIKRIKELGHEVLVSDYTSDAPGKKFADYTTNVSTFDRSGVLQVSKQYEIDGILTAGTDQPVLTAAETAAELGLPSFVSVNTALAVTNKRVMKPLMVSDGIPTNPFILINAEVTAKDFEIAGFSFPIVIKPVDSQGQRGVLKIETQEELYSYIPYSLEFSRETELLAEPYYPSDEITVTSWVHDGEMILISITDRITSENLPYIGVCYAHRYPSVYQDKYLQEIRDISTKIIDTFGITNGPVYTQILIGAEGVRVNEIACRIGGAYEDEAIPLLTGINLTDMLIEGSAGRVSSEILHINSSLPVQVDAGKQGYCAVLLFFTKPGKIAHVGSFSTLMNLPGVSGGAYQIEPGDVISIQKNAVQRAGYVIISAETAESLQDYVTTVYNQIDITDSNGEQMVIPLPDNRFLAKI